MWRRKDIRDSSEACGPSCKTCNFRTCSVNSEELTIIIVSVVSGVVVLVVRTFTWDVGWDVHVALCALKPCQYPVVTGFVCPAGG